MSSRWFGTVCVAAVLAIAAGCSRPQDAVKVCKIGDPNDCETYASKAALDREVAREMARRRRYAETLPFDYRDALHALLIDYLDPSDLSNVDSQYFVGVFGSDIDEVLTARLHASGIEVRPISAWTFTDERAEDGRVKFRSRVEIGSIKHVGRGAFSIGFSYYCGGLCAGGLTYTLHKDGDQWRIVDRRTHWNS